LSFPKNSKKVPFTFIDGRNPREKQNTNDNALSYREAKQLRETKKAGPKACFSKYLVSVD